MPSPSQKKASPRRSANSRPTTLSHLRVSHKIDAGSPVASGSKKYKPPEEDESPDDPNEEEEDGGEGEEGEEKKESSEETEEETSDDSVGDEKDEEEEEENGGESEEGEGEEKEENSEESERETSDDSVADEKDEEFPADIPRPTRPRPWSDVTALHFSYRVQLLAQSVFQPFTKEQMRKQLMQAKDFAEHYSMLSVAFGQRIKDPEYWARIQEQGGLLKPTLPLENGHRQAPANRLIRGCSVLHGYE